MDKLILLKYSIVLYYLFMIFRICRYFGRKFMGNYLWTPALQSSFKDYCLEYTEDVSQLDNIIEKTKNDAELGVLIANGAQAIFVRNGRSLQRMSPMLIRLAKLYKDA